MKKQIGQRWFTRRAATAAAVTTALVLSAGMTGCAPASDSSGPVTITYGLWAEEFRPAFQEAATAFEKENPNVTVELVVTPFDNYFTKLNTQVSSKTAPDVFWLQNVHVDLYARNGALADLTELRAASTTDLSGIPDSVSDPYVIDDKLYAMPWQALPFGLYYNEALFTAAGVDVPTNDWNWDDVAAAAAQLTDASTGQYGIVAPVWNYGTYYQTMYQQGASIITEDRKSTDFDSPEAVAGLDVWTNFVKEGYSPTPAQLSDTPPDSMFTSGKAAMITTGPWVAAGYSGALGDSAKVVEMPVDDLDVTGYATTTSAVSASTKHLPEAYKFAEFLSSDEGQKILASSGIAGAPVNANANDSWIAAVPGVGVENLLAQIPNAILFPSSNATSVWEDKLVPTLSPAYDGTISTEDAAKQMAEIIKTALAAE